MAPWTFYRLDPKPGAGFHFGLRGLEGEASGHHCPSDTFFAALVDTLAHLGGDDAVRAFVAPFEAGRPSFLPTSAYPRAGDLPLLPRPFVRIKLAERHGQHKFHKRLRYVSPGIFAALLRSASIDALGPGGDQGRFLQGGQVWLQAGEQAALPASWRTLSPDELREQKVWAVGPVDRVAVDRVSSASSIYRIGRTTYAPGCGLWLGAQWPDGVKPVLASQLDMLLHHLGDRGLGGERSVGYGQFTVGELSAIPDLPAADGAYALTLARYLPAAGELPAVLRGGAAYGLESIGGWMGTPDGAAYRRKSVRVLVEGSVLHVGDREPPWGRLVDVCPDTWEGHPVWRCGFACPVGVEVQDA